MQVWKFGGTSVGKPERMHAIKNLITEDGNRKIVVLSALSGTTNALISIGESLKANNDAEAYAYGLDLRLNGEFVPGTESWLSIGYLKTEENQNDKGFIARPTDQRLKVGVLLFN